MRCNKLLKCSVRARLRFIAAHSVRRRGESGEKYDGALAEAAKRLFAARNSNCKSLRE